MPIDHPAAARLKEKFPALVAAGSLKGAQFKGDTQIIIPREALLEVVQFLKNDPALSYNMLADVTAVDYLNFSGAAKDGRFGLVYVFNSVPSALSANQAAPAPRLILRVFIDEPNLAVDSLVPIYAGAEWLEREVYDMFGIIFNNHPDLRRILTWDGFKAHPLRKDYPVTGRGERERYPILTRDSA